MKETNGYYGKSRTEMLEFIPVDAKKILDIGCAEGIFSALVKEARGAEVWGVEMGVEVATRAQEKIATDWVSVYNSLSQEELATLRAQYSSWADKN